MHCLLPSAYLTPPPCHPSLFSQLQLMDAKVAQPQMVAWHSIQNPSITQAHTRFAVAAFWLGLFEPYRHDFDILNNSKTLPSGRLTTCLPGCLSARLWLTPCPLPRSLYPKGNCQVVSLCGSLMRACLRLPFGIWLPNGAYG